VVGGPVMGGSMASLVTTAAYMSADQTNPQRVGSLALHANGIFNKLGRLHVAAHRAGRVAPLHQAAGVKGMIAQDGQDSIHALIHALQAHWTGGQFRVSHWWASVFAPFYSRDPHSVAQRVRFQGVVSNAIVGLVELQS